MAINKKLITFTKKSVFLGDKGIKGQTTPTNGYYGNIPATSIVFILDTGELWTHGKYISGGVWGEKNANYIPLNIRGTSYNLSLDGHTHSQYLTQHQDLSAYAKQSWVSDNFSASGHTHTTLASLGDNTSINATNYSSGFTPKPYYGISPSTGTAPSTYGNILEYVSNNKGGGQLAMEWTGSQTNTNGTDTNVGRLYYRSKRDCIGGWTTWKTVAWTTDIPTTLKNPKALTTFGVAYDGSEAKTVTTATFISQLSEGTSNVTDGTMFVTSYASDNGFADTNAVNTPYKRKASCLYNYIKGKTDTLYAAKGHTHDGRYLRWAGSSADTSAMNWGTLTTANGYTILSHASSAEGGDIGWVCKGGQIFQQLDGYYYQNEGKYRVLDTSDSSSFAAASHTHDGRYVYNYGGTNCGTAGLGGNYMGMTTGSGISSDWWHILSAAWNSEYRWNSQIAFPTQNRSTMYFRSGKDDNSGWGEWKRLALYSDIPSTLKNPKALTIQTNGTSLGSYDGAEAKTWNITYSNVGAAAASHTHNYLPLSGGTLTGGLILQGTIDGSSYATSEGYYTNTYNNIILRGDTTYGKSGILFTSSKGTTSINQTSDKGFIQFQPYGGTNTSGEANKLIIGVGNDGDDMVYLQTPSATGLKHAVGTNVYTIWDANNDGSGSGLDADLLDGLHVHTGRNNEANKIVRTDGNGYIQCGYINSSNGNEGNNSSPARVWGTNGSDNYLRTYLTSALSVGYASSAGQLLTGRYLWGQQFNGSKDVNGTIYINGGSDNYREGIRLNSNSNGWTTIMLKGTDNSNDWGTSTKSWSIHTYDGNFYINKNNSSGQQAPRLWGHSNGWTIGNTNISSYTLNVGGYTQATGFIRNSSDDSYVLTGGGGHKKWTTGNTANALVARDGNGYMYSSYINTAINAEDSGTVNYIYYSYDNWIRKMSYNRLKNILNSDLSFVKWSSYRKNSSTTIKTIENVFAPAVGTSDNRIHIGAMSSINNDYDDWKFGLGSFIKIDPKTSGGNISICANNSVGIIGNGVNINAYSSELNLMSSSIHAITSGIKGLFLTSNYGLHSGTNKLVLPSGDTRAYILARNGFAIEVGATPASNYSCDDHPSSPAYSSLYLDSGMTFVGVGNGQRNGMVAESGVVRMRVKDKSVLKLQENAVTTFTNTYIGESGNSTSLSVYGTVYSAGFSKSGSNDNYVLTGGGGHKAISDFITFYGDISAADNYDAVGLKVIGVTGGSSTMGNGYGSILQMCNNAARSTKPNINNGYACWYTQIMGNTDDNLRFRTSTNGSGWTAWKKLIHSGNIGSQSVSNADKIDGYHASGLFTALSNSNNGISITIGGTTKSISSISVNYANTSQSSTWLNANTSLNYGANGLQYFNHYTSITSGSEVNASPTSDWYHIIRMNHANANGYYVDLASCFHSNAIYYRRIADGTDNGWIRVIDSSNIGSQSVSYATGSENADKIDGYHISVLSALPSNPNSNTLYFIY